MRLFIGLSVDAATRCALDLLREALEAQYAARYVPPALYHLTLAYLGERSEASLAALCGLLDTVAGETAPLMLNLSGIGCFCKPHDTILYASVIESPSLQALSARLREALSAAGETFDAAPFTPHITLARKAQCPANPQLIQPFSATLSVQTLTLFHSHRTDGILRYDPIYQAAFHADLMC